MKRVLITVHKFFPDHRAGTEVLALKVGQELQRRGLEVLVVTADPPDTDARHVSGPDTSDLEYGGLRVKVFREPLRLRGYQFDWEYRHPPIGEQFAKILEEFRPDILHIFHAQNLSASIIDEARLRGIPVVCSTTDFWFVCPIVQLKLPDGSVCRGPSKGAANCLKCYTPRLFPPAAEFEEAITAKYPLAAGLLNALPGTLRNTAVASLFEIYKGRKRPAAENATKQRPAVLRDAANRVQAIMVPTKLMRDIFVENGIKPELIRHVPFGIDTEPLVAYQQKLPSKTLRIGFIGTLFEHKGVDLLIRAFQALPADADAVLRIYGDVNQFPEYGAHLQKLADHSNEAGKIVFCGTFPNDRLGAVLQDLDVLVVPSRWYENTPLVMQSALATRTPLIATNLGGMAELVQHGRNGLLFELNSVESLKEQLLRLLSDRPFLRQMQQSIPPERTVAEMVDEIQCIYQSAQEATARDRISALKNSTGACATI